MIVYTSHPETLCAEFYRLVSALTHGERGAGDRLDEHMLTCPVCAAHFAEPLPPLPDEQEEKTV